MANQRHVKLLAKSVDKWNLWRRKHPRAVIDLSYASLGKANLSHANLSRTNLSHAFLGYTNLSHADLSYANLSHADLGKADLSMANLSGANVSESLFFYTLVRCVDLRDVQGLETVRHKKTSTLGVETIYRSQGRIPETFLRGCGVYDDGIVLARSISGAIQYHSLFISYSSRDRGFVERIVSDFKEKGISYWYDQGFLKIGDDFWTMIEQAIANSDKVLVVLSKNSLRSAAVEREVMFALDRESPMKKILFPICIDDDVMNSDVSLMRTIRNTRQIGQFGEWRDSRAYQSALDKLMDDLRQGSNTIHGVDHHIGLEATEPDEREGHYVRHDGERWYDDTDDPLGDHS